MRLRPFAALLFAAFALLSPAAAQKPGAPALPGMHTDGYAPVPEPSIRAGVRTMSLAAMNLMPKEK